MSFATIGLGQHWTSLTPLPDGYQEHILVYANGFLYNIGGASSRNAEVDGTNVFYAQVYNGTIGTWNHTTPLPEAVFDSAGVADSGFVYVIAGIHYDSNLNADLVTNVVYYAKVNPNGSLGSWQTTVPLPKSVYWHNVGVWRHKIYSIAGCDVNGGADANVYSATVQFDGTLSAWATQPSLPLSRCAHGQAVNGALYVIAGSDNANPTNGVLYTKISDNGNLTGWNSATAYPQKVINGAAVASAGWILGFGGWNGVNPINGVYEAQVSGDCSINTWAAGDSLPQALLFFGVAANDSYIFVSGGEGSRETSSAVYSMPLPSQPASPILNSPVIRTNQTFQLQLTSTTNTGFGIQASANLTTWTNIGWGFTDTNGTLTFQDTNAAALPKRFYRAYWPLP